MIRPLAALVGVLLLAAPVADASVTTAPDRVVVEMFSPGAATDEVTLERLRAAGVAPVELAPGSRFLLADARDASPSGWAGVSDVVRAVHPVQYLRASAAPNDPLYPVQWHLPALQAETAWTMSTGAGAVVAVIDTGIAKAAPDFAGTRFATGFDWIDDDAIADDDNGHGTHVAGSIAEGTNNGAGGAGLAYGATIMPLRALDAEGIGSDFDIALAIRYAADHGAHVINLSLGAPSGSAVLADAVAYAAGRNVTIVAAAGNDATNRISFPAAYPQVIAVGAVGFGQTRAPYSNTGPEIDVVAPGGNLAEDRNGDGNGDGILQQTRSTTGGWCYCFYQGTSMATPQVAATAALLVARGVRDRNAITAAIVGTARDLGPAGLDQSYGNGLVQPANALRAASPTSPPSALPGAPLPAIPTPEAPGVALVARDIDPACPSAKVPRGRFSDVDPASVHSRAIDCAAWLEITVGSSGGGFRPASAVRRDQMASFLARAIERTGRSLPASPPDAFDDDDGNAHELRVNQLAALGIVRGSTRRTFDPANPVSRGAMATFLARTYDALATEDLAAAGDLFDDDNGHTHEEQIDRVAAAAVASGTGIRRFNPQGPVRRDQMASFITRLYAALVDADEVPPPS